MTSENAFKEAQYQIWKCFNKTLGTFEGTILNLNHLLLDSIPNEIYQLDVLKHLHLKNTRISDITMLSNLTSLESIELTKTNVEDISPLQHLSNLEIVWLYSTPFANKFHATLPQVKGGCNLLTDGKLKIFI